MSPARGPDGQFISGGDMDRYDDLEQVTSTKHLSVPASAANGATGQSFGQTTHFDGVQLYDLDDFLDRQEEAHLLYARHRLLAVLNSTATADGVVRVQAEVSTGDTRQVVRKTGAYSDIESTQNPAVEEDDRTPAPDDTIDLLGPPLESIGYSPITDGVNGVGGTGATVPDVVEIRYDPDVADNIGLLDERDEVNVNGTVELQNVDDNAAHVFVQMQHLMGIFED